MNDGDREVPAKPKPIVGGMLRCSKCGRRLAATQNFHKSSSSTSGYRSECKDCGSPKLRVLEPDYKIISSKLIKLEPYSDTKVASGGWERLVRRVALLSSLEVAQVFVGKGYRTHQSSHMAIVRAARKFGTKVSLHHQGACIYILNADPSL